MILNPLKMHEIKEFTVIRDIKKNVTVLKISLDINRTVRYDDS